MLNVKIIQEIAEKKGLRFAYSEPDEAYVMFDKKTGQALEIYANITLELIISEKIWREECNKLRTSSNR